MDDPPGFDRRLAAYREFRRRLAAPLATVELSLDGKFHLNAGDADILVRVEGGDVLWQKERLLKVGFEAPPDSCDALAWLDCDVLFERSDWSRVALEKLERSAQVQLFSEVRYLETAEPPEDVRQARVSHRRQGLVGALKQGRTLDSSSAKGEHGPAPGLAWAARREVLHRNGLYDAMPFGCGDRAVVCASYGLTDEFAARFDEGAPQREHYLRWARGWHADVAGAVDCLEGTLYHLWHGSLQARRYQTRYSGFERFRFDPQSDLRVAPGGAWSWNSNKPELHRAAKEYFDGRRAG